ncbi:MAG: PAS domain S-box protein [Anaerolineales bacterium]
MTKESGIRAKRALADDQAARLLALYRFSRALAEGSPERDSILRISTSLAAEHLNGGVLNVLCQSQSGVLGPEAYLCTASGRLEQQVVKPLTMEEIRADRGWMLPEQPAVLKSGDVPLVDLWRDWNLDAAIELQDMSGVLLSPLVAHEECQGLLLGFLEGEAEKPDQEELDFWLDFSQRLALALANAELVESLRKQLDARTKAERSLHESEELFRTIFLHSALGIKVLDPQGRILRSNPALARILERDTHEIDGEHFSAFTHPLDREKNIRFFKRLLAGQLRSSVFTKRYLTPSGEIIWAKLTFTRVTDQEGESSLVIGMVEDITSQKKMEMEILEMRSMLLESAENERLRLAQELHDGPMQDLHSINYQLVHLKRKPEETSKGLQSIQQELQGVIHTLRNTASELRPPALLDFGLVKAIRSHAEEFAEDHSELTIHLELAEDRGMLTDRMGIGLFRIYQHSLMNVVRHAEADNVWVIFKMDAETIRLEITDDGHGFDVPGNWIEFVRSGHFGLAGAAERAQSLGGDLEVESEIGQGTTVRVELVNSLELYVEREGDD